MHKFPGREPDLTSSVDKFLEKCKEEPEQEDNLEGMHSTEKINMVNDDTDSTRCAFKDTCYTGKFKTGQCPCELIR